MTVIISIMAITVIIVRAFLELCDKVGGEVSALGPMVDKAFKVSIILTKIKMLQLIMKMLMVITPLPTTRLKENFCESLPCRQNLPTETWRPS